MNAAEVIEQAKKSGVSVKLVDGRLRASLIGVAGVGAGMVPTDVIKLLREHRDGITAHLTPREEDERYGKAPPAGDEPPMRAVAPRGTNEQMVAVVEYVRRQAWPREPKGSECPFTWAIVRADAYAHWAKDKWATKDFFAAAALDLVCWQRRATDDQALRWLEHIAAAGEDLGEGAK